MHENVLVFKRFRWARVSAVLLVVCTTAYVLLEPPTGHSGGTWLGYTLGVLGLLLILQLAYFGARKRDYNAGGPSLQEWLSAHVWLGVAVVWVGTLHSGFQFGPNIHTLAWALMCGVVLTGMLGLVLYLRVPALRSRNRRGLTQEELLRAIAGTDAQAREIAAHLDDRVAAEVDRAARETHLAEGIVDQLRGRVDDCPTTAAVQLLQEIADDMDDEEGMQEVLVVLARKEALLVRARTELRHRALLHAWLYLHVPLTFGLLASLVVHVLVVLAFR
jgi:hypothetical protein